MLLVLFGGALKSQEVVGNVVFLGRLDAFLNAGAVAGFWCAGKRVHAGKRGQAYFINYELCMLPLCLDQSVSNLSMPFTT